MPLRLHPFLPASASCALALTLLTNVPAWAQQQNRDKDPQTGIFSNQRFGVPMDRRIDRSVGDQSEQRDQPLDSNAAVGSSLLGTTLDSTLIDGRLNANQALPELPPRERGNIAEERSGRIDDPDRSRPITR